MTNEKPRIIIPEEPKIIITIEGGVVRSISATSPVKCTVIDIDDSASYAVQCYTRTKKEE